MVSKGRAAPDFFKTEGTACLSMLASPCLSTPTIVQSCTPSYKKEKSMDGSISSSKRRSMLNTLSRKTSKVWIHSCALIPNIFVLRLISSFTVLIYVASSRLICISISLIRSDARNVCFHPLSNFYYVVIGVSSLIFLRTSPLSDSQISAMIARKYLFKSKINDNLGILNLSKTLWSNPQI